MLDTRQEIIQGSRFKIQGSKLLAIKWLLAIGSNI